MNVEAEPLQRVFQAALEPELNTQDLGVLLNKVPGLGSSLRGLTKVFYPYVAGDLQDAVRAAVLLGPRVVLDLAVVHAFLEGAPLHGPVGAAFWTECLRRGLAARLLSEHVDDLAPDTAFAAGIALEYGVSAHLKDSHAAFRWTHDVRHLHGRARQQAERDTLGVSRTDAFLSFGRAWSIPENIVYAVAHHHQPVDRHPPSTRELCRVAHLADGLGQVLASHNVAEGLEGWVTDVVTELRTDPSTVWDMVQDVLVQTEAVAAALDVPVEPQPSLDQLCAGIDQETDPASMSREELTDWANLLKAEAEAVQAEAHRLQAELDSARNRDPLTGLPNHAQFLQTLRQLASDHAQRDAPLTLLHFDLDGFSAINHHYGFAVGDRILCTLAEALPRVVGAGATLARVGADSFAVALDADERHGRLISERLRALVEGASLVLDTNHKVRTTARAVGRSEIPRSGQEADRMLTDLYRAALTARGAGRNSVNW